MIDKISIIFSSFLCSLCVIYVITKIGNIKYTKTKYLLCSILMFLIIYLLYMSKYQSEILLLKIVVFIILIKIIFRVSIYKSILTTIISMLIMTIGEIITSIALIKFITVDQARTEWYYVLFCNSIVYVTMIIIVNIRPINKIINRVIEKGENKGKLKAIILFIISILIMAYLLYNFSVNYGWNEKYIITVMIMISYIIISVIFFKDKLEYTMLEEKYDMLFEYFSEISENIDELNLTTHEYKNQIAIVGNYIDNKKYKKAREYINDIASSINKDEGLLVNLSDIPKGGLKGLLYYKIIVAKNQKVEIVLDVGKNVKRNLNKLSEDEIKIITRIIGVYIDNAVSASKNKIINIEIYNLDDELYFTISNKIDKNVNIDNIGKKGFTTKGKGHGKGIYLTNRLIARNKWLKSENRIVNNYYICKLIIDTKNIGN